MQITIPMLEKTKRDTEYSSYDPILRAKVIYGYLFKGMSHRALDSHYLGKDENKSRGWQSMGILHYLGLTAKHKNLFEDLSLGEGVNVIQKDQTQDYSLILEHLLLLKSPERLDSSNFLRRFEKAVLKSLKDSSETRQKRLQNAVKKPSILEVTTTVFQRNPDVVAEVLARANGICEECKQPAPFLRKKDNSPYLEVHHRTPLALDGDDTVDNALALCPNCHRKMHFG